MNAPNLLTPANFRTAMRLTAAVPLVTGLGAALFGPEFLPGAQGHVDATLAQEFRFFAVWWTAVALYLWSLAGRIEHAGREFAVACLVLLASGLARWVSFATHGWPHPLFIVLAAIEVSAPLPLIWLQRSIALDDGTAQPA